MPTETPASARDADASANPPAINPIKRIFFQFMVLTLQINLTLFETQSFANYSNLSGPPYFGLVGELIVYEASLSKPERVLVHTYLKARWKTR